MTVNNTQKIVLITGANKGIGREVAERLAELGFRVILGCRDRERGERAVAEILSSIKEGQTKRPDPLVEFIEIDMADDNSIARAAEHVRRNVGRLDVLINNAATGVGAALPSEQSLDAMRTIFATNVFGVMALTQHLLPLLRESKSGRIINMSSTLGSLTYASDPTHYIAQTNSFFAYSASKTALNTWTVRLGQELQGTRIRVCAACPGYVATDLNGHQGTRTVQEGARIVLKLATEEEGPNGFFNEAGPVPW